MLFNEKILFVSGEKQNIVKKLISILRYVVVSGRGYWPGPERHGGGVRVQHVGRGRPAATGGIQLLKPGEGDNNSAMRPLNQVQIGFH